MIKKILPFVACVVLVLVIGIEFKIGSDMLNKQNSFDTTTLIETINAVSRKDINVKKVVGMMDFPPPSVTGDVFEVDGLKVQVNGTVLSYPTSYDSYVMYTDNTIDDDGHHSEHMLEWQTGEKDYREFVLAYDKYFNDEVDALYRYLPISYQDENISPCKMVTSQGTFPVLYDAATNKYYLFVALVDEYKIFSCDQTFILTDAMLTATYPAAGEDPMTEHVYSNYEIDAINNTRLALSEGEYDGPALMQNNVSTNYGVYNSSTDMDVRNRYVAYAHFKWNPDGSSPDTNDTIDTHSAAAVQAEWKCREASSEFGTTIAGLRLEGLNGRFVTNANPSTFEWSGNLTNVASNERPYAVLVKYLDENRQILAVRTIGGPNAIIQANQTVQISGSISSNEGVNIDDIKLTQFEFR